MSLLTNIISMGDHTTEILPYKDGVFCHTCTNESYAPQTCMWDFLSTAVICICICVGLLIISIVIVKCMKKYADHLLTIREKEYDFKLKERENEVLRAYFEKNVDNEIRKANIEDASEVEKEQLQKMKSLISEIDPLIKKGLGISISLKDGSNKVEIKSPCDDSQQKSSDK